MPLIQFSNRIHHILRKSMALSVIVKLLGRKIRFNTLSSKLFSLRKPSQPLKLMDVENNYFLVKFRPIEDNI
ncbi:hypothetical protein Gohar_003106 [Gossypium harknessii]|uniref:Uncharacterized protein n=1 Tax=Gossypium harknessii TaxID=34285 RepID=A0A7J9HMW8_9ROSI|nr:hypothetical protein [Gossypium harknessii]